jgi:hypothetical protein
MKTEHADRQRRLCERLQILGYARHKSIRLYGEELDLVSDPVPDGDGIVIRAVNRRSGRLRQVPIPLMTVRMVLQELESTDLGLAA